MKKGTNYKNKNWEKAHEYFGLKKGDNLVLQDGETINDYVETNAKIENIGENINGNN